MHRNTLDEEPKVLHQGNNFYSTPMYKMSKSRVIGAGATIGRANRGGGFNTAGNQGGGDKLQGLVSTTNRPVVFSSYVRTRADGGDSRNWVFCTNQLGGVGRRWGQAAGPGNRGGVHAVCKHHAHRSRQRYPRRPKQSSGWGNPRVHRANYRSRLTPPAPCLPDVCGYYGVPMYSNKLPFDIVPNPPTLAELNSATRAYNVIILGCISFSAPSFVEAPVSDVNFQLRVPDPGTDAAEKTSMLTVTVSNLANDAYATPTMTYKVAAAREPGAHTTSTGANLYAAFQKDLEGWLGGVDAWGRTRRALVSIGEANPAVSDMQFPANDGPVVKGLGPVARPVGVYRAALNLVYLMQDLGATVGQTHLRVGLDLTTRSAAQASSFLHQVAPLVQAFPSVPFESGGNIPCQPYLRCSPGGIAPDALEPVPPYSVTPETRGLVRTLLAGCDALAYPCTEDPSTLADGKLAIAPGLWGGFQPQQDAPPTWATMSAPPQPNARPAVCAAIWLVTTATRYLYDDPSTAGGSITNTRIPVAATLPPCPLLTENTWSDAWFSDSSSPAFQALVTSYGDGLTKWCSCSCPGTGIPCPDLCSLSIEWDAAPDGTSGVAAWAFASAAEHIVENVKNAQCPSPAPTGKSYTVSGSAGNVFDGKYVRFSPASGQKLPPLPAWAQDAYVLQSATGGPTATPLLYAKGSGGPHWILGEVDLTTGTLNAASATNPIVWSFCATQCSTPPHAGWQGVAGAVAVTVTPGAGALVDARLPTPPAVTSYTVTGAESNVFNGTYSSPTSGQKAPPVPAWAQGAYVLEGCQDSSGCPVLYPRDVSGCDVASRCMRGPAWFLGAITQQDPVGDGCAGPFPGSDPAECGTVAVSAPSTQPCTSGACLAQWATPPEGGWEDYSSGAPLPAIKVTPKM